MSKVQRGNGAPDQATHDKDMGLRSITPTTHLKRDLYRDAADLRVGGPVGDIDDAIFYQDCYRHDTWSKEIISFGINVYNISIRTELAKHNAAQQCKLTGLGTISNASSNPQNYAKLVSQIILTTYEMELMQSAAAYLTPPPRKVVLVDTFARTLQAGSGLKLGDIAIPSSNTDPLETHTVVLYKNSKGDILVIDPNKPTFSGHLQHTKPVLGCNVLVSSGPPDLNKIYTSKPIITPKTGPSGKQFRDCTDIAAKLAALLDQDPNDYADVSSVMKSKAVHLVSNTAIITKLPEKAVEDQACRVKQVSHLTKMEKINDELQKYNTSLRQDISNAKAKCDAAQAAAKAALDQEEKDAYNTLDVEVSTLIGQCGADPELSGGHYA